MNAVVLAQSNLHSLSLEDIYRQGITQYEQGYYLEAIAKFENILSNSAEISTKDRVLVEEKLARSYHLAGYGDRAIEYWDKTLNYFRLINDLPKIAQISVEKAQSYLILGQPRQSLALLCNPQQQLELSQLNQDVWATEYERSCHPNSPIIFANYYQNKTLTLAAEIGLAETLRLIGGSTNYAIAIAFLKRQKQNYSKEQNFSKIISINLSLGQLFRSQALVNHRRAVYAKDHDGNRQEEFQKMAKGQELEAQLLFKEILRLEPEHSVLKKVQARLGLINSYYQLGDFSSIEQELNLLYIDTQKLPYSRRKALTLIDIASFFFDLEKNNSSSLLLAKNVEKILEESVEIGKQIKDFRIQSFALGKLGHLYEYRAEKDYSILETRSQKNIEKALQLTMKARILSSQDQQNKDSLYLWEWQSARLYHKLNQFEAERKAYEAAINTLKKIRLELIASNTELRFDFQESVEPVYKDFTKILLAFAQNLEEGSFLQSQILSTANETLNELRLAELQNFFGGDCNFPLFSEDSISELIDENTATVRSVVFQNRSYLIASFFNKNNFLYTLDISFEDLQRQIRDLREILSNTSNRHKQDFQPPAEKLYKTLFPDELTQQLENNQIDTLVFIGDALLRQIPMAALFDGQQYLIEKYAIASTPSLEVTVPKKSMRLTKKPALLIALENTEVGTELPLSVVERDTLQSVFEQSTTMPNEQYKFTIQGIASALEDQDYSIVHIATHGKFDFDPELSFLLTEDSKLAMPRFEEMMRQVNTDQSRIDILVLTGCETAVGGPRSSLGLAGIALQSGVSSAIASLWPIADAESNILLMKEFYEHYLHGETKAKSLQQAQIKLIHGENSTYERPYYWSPFILVGNWL